MNQRSSTRVTALLAPLLATILATGLAAQASEELVQRDLAFAEGLADRYRYVDLAERVLEDVQRIGYPEELEEEVALAECNVYAQGARYASDLARRAELHEKAIESYKGFLEEHPYSPLAPEAQRAHVDLANRYARLLEDMLEDAAGEEAERLRERIRNLLDEGLDRVRDLIEELELVVEPDAVERNRMHELLLAKGQMLTTMGRAAEEGTFYFAQAEETLEDLALQAGERSGAGLQAYLQLARAQTAQGKYRDAADFSSYVVDFAVPRNLQARQGEAWTLLPFDLKSRRWELVEIGTPILLEALSNEGATEEAVEWALYYNNAWKSEGFELNPLGHLALLRVARTLLEAGGYVGGSLGEGNLQWFPTQAAMQEAGFRSSRDTRTSLELALGMAETVNEENRGNVLQVRAQTLIADVIERPGVDVSPAVLFEAAAGQFSARDYARALSAYKRVLAGLDAQDQATRLEYMPKVLHGVGSSLSRMDRHIEAAMAFREAATTWKGDPEYQDQNARGYWQAIGRVRAQAGGDPRIEELYLEAENMVAAAASAAGGAGEIHWRRAERAYQAGRYQEAREEYLQVPASEEIHERARVKAALCLLKLDDDEGAAREFEDYLTHYVRDPANAVVTKGLIDTRREASAMATYYLGYLAYLEKDWEAVERWLAGYEESFPAQTDYGPAALRLLLQAAIAESDVAKIRDVVGRLGQSFPESATTGKAAVEACVALKPLQEEAKERGDEAAVDRLVRERAEYLSLGNDLDDDPSYTNLRQESLLWLQVGAWAEAEGTLRELGRRFRDDPEREGDVARQVLPDLGHVLLEQERVPEAFEVLDPLVPDPLDEEAPRKPASSTVRDWCRAVTGWVRGDAGTIVEVPGVGGDENFGHAAIYLDRLQKAEENDSGKWTCPWYRIKFQTIYAYYRWGQIDSKRLTTAKETLDNLRTTTFDPELELVEEKCVDDLLRRRFLWLSGKLG